MRRWPTVAVVAVAALAPTVTATAQPAAADRLLVMPFDNVDREPRIYWLGEAASVLLTDGLNALGANAITRGERVRAFEQLHVPATASLSRATVVKVGQLVGASEVVIGDLGLSGSELSVRVRRIRLDAGRMQADLVETGPLTELFPLFDRLARRLASSAHETAAPVQGAEARPPLEAFESYIKGLLAEKPPTQVSYLEQAIAAAPAYDRARLALWEVYAEQGDHAKALAAVQAVTDESPHAREARFAGALSRLELKQYDAALASLKALAGTQPAPELYNASGVALLRKGAWTPQTGRPTFYFNKAAELDAENPDYVFNLGYAYAIEGDMPPAVYWLREAVRLNPADGDAHFVLGAALQASGSAVEAAREKELARQLAARYADGERPAAAEPVPRALERLERHLRAPGAPRVESVIVKSAQRDQREAAAFHLDRARRLAEQQHDPDAIAELRRALYLAPYQADAHLLLGRIYLRTGRVREAIDALKISIWSGETVAARLALAEAYLQDKNVGAARTEAQRALALAPASDEAKALLQRIELASPR